METLVNARNGVATKAATNQKSLSPSLSPVIKEVSQETILWLREVYTSACRVLAQERGGSLRAGISAAGVRYLTSYMGLSDAEADRVVSTYCRAIYGILRLADIDLGDEDTYARVLERSVRVVVAQNEEEELVVWVGASLDDPEKVSVRLRLEEKRKPATQLGQADVDAIRKLLSL